MSLESDAVMFSVGPRLLVLKVGKSHDGSSTLSSASLKLFTKVNIERKTDP